MKRQHTWYRSCRYRDGGYCLLLPTLAGHSHVPQKDGGVKWELAGEAHFTYLSEEGQVMLEITLRHYDDGKFHGVPPRTSLRSC